MSKRILLLPSGIGRSHATRLRLIADQLALLNYEIACVCPETHRALFASYRWFPTVDVTDFNTNVYTQYNLELVERCVRDEMGAIEVFQPDLIVADLRLTAAISARVAQIPFVSVVNAALTRHFNPVTVLDSTPHWSAKLLGTFVQERQKKALAQHFTAVARQFQLNHLVSLSDFLEGDTTFIADLPQFCPLERLPNNHYFIGPLIWESETIQQPVLEISHPLVYVTIGNTGSAQLIEAIINAFRSDTTYRLVITTGAYVDAATFSPPPHITIANFIPGSHILPHACAVIHCGGSGTTYQAIRHGVPALVIPFNNEQRINARLVHKHRLGHYLSPRKQLAFHLLPALQQLLQTDYAPHLAQFQRLFRLPGEKVAARRIELMLEDV